MTTRLLSLVAARDARSKPILSLEDLLYRGHIASIPEPLHWGLTSLGYKSGLRCSHKGGGAVPAVPRVKNREYLSEPREEFFRRGSIELPRRKAQPIGNLDPFQVTSR
jgi:hypothetical protein